MKAMIYGAGGGTSSDEVTALKKHFLSPYTTITNDSGDEIVAGTMLDNGAVNRSLKCGESYTIVEGFHNGSGVISADSLASQTGANAAAGDILTGKTAWVNGIKLTGTLPTMAGGTKTPSTSQITVACSGYKMTSNITIPAFSLPDKSKLISGYVYSIYGKSVTGTATEYVQNSNIYKEGGTKPSSTGLNGSSIDNGNDYINVSNSGGTAKMRINNTIDLTKYNYLHCKVFSRSGGTVTCVVSKNSDGSSPEKTATYKGSDWGEAIINVSSLKGMYYLVMYSNAISLFVKGIYLSTT